MATYYIEDTPGLMKPHKRSLYENVAQFMARSNIPRTSRLIAPIERFEDHKADVLTCEFHPLGELVMSAGHEGLIHIGSVFEPQSNVMVLNSQFSVWGAVMEAHFSADGTHLYSCSSNSTISIWDTFTGIKLSTLIGHSACVNTVQRARGDLSLLCSGGDDTTVRVWDVRQPTCASVFQNCNHITAACFDKTGENVFTGGLEKDIKIWDVRMSQVVLKLQGHHDVITGVSLSPCGSYLLTHSVDNTLRIWDIRPSYTGERCIQIIGSNQRIINGNLLRCKWSPDGTRISSGIADTRVPLWDTIESRQMPDLLGPDCNVNDVDFHPKDQIIVSASSGGFVFMHELID